MSRIAAVNVMRANKRSGIPASDGSFQFRSPGISIFIFRSVFEDWCYTTTSEPRVNNCVSASFQFLRSQCGGHRQQDRASHGEFDSTFSWWRSLFCSTAREHHLYITRFRNGLTTTRLLCEIIGVLFMIWALWCNGSFFRFETRFPSVCVFVWCIWSLCLLLGKRRHWCPE